MVIELRALGGAVNEKTADFNAWPFREAEIMIAYFLIRNIPIKQFNYFNQSKNLGKVCTALIQVTRVRKRMREFGQVQQERK